MLRRRIFLGLTLPQVAACGVAFTFWLHHAAGLSHGTGGERLLAVVGSLVFTLAGMGLLVYLDRHATGSPEGRLAAAYALASALTLLFVVFNPAGELEILNLLKGEVIALSKEPVVKKSRGFKSSHTISTMRLPVSAAIFAWFESTAGIDE